MTGYFYVPTQPSTVDDTGPSRLPSWVAAPGPGECHVWWADAVPVRLGWLGMLDERERARLADCRLLADRDAFGTAAVALRTAVGGYLGRAPAEVAVDWETGTVADRYAIAAAHSGRRVGVVVSTAGPVGLGLQWLAAATGDGTARTARQAIRQAGGAPRGFRLAPPGQRPAVLGWPRAPLLYALHPAPGYAGTLAVHSGTDVDVCEYLFRPGAAGPAVERAA